MPNWCYESAKVFGPRADVLRFREAITVADSLDEEYSLNGLYPCPQELLDTTSGWSADADKQAALVAQQQENIRKYDYKDWYDWCIAHYGTKWGACNVSCSWWELPDEGTATIHLGWESAWSPSAGLVREVSRQYPTLTFAVFVEEEAHHFLGWYVVRHGRVLGQGSVEPPDAGMPMPPEGCSDSGWGMSAYHDELNDWIDSLRDSLDNKMNRFLEQRGLV